MDVTQSAQSVIGVNAEAYAQRDEGYSPEYIRDAVWNLVSQDVQGDVLDVGSGAGGWIRHLQQSNRLKKVISVDIVDDGASQIPGVEFHLADLSMQAMPCADDQLDWIFAIEVIEHLANPRNFIQQSARVLKPGGRLVLSTPYNENFKGKLSFVMRGYFPAFCDHIYHLGGHITPIFEIDLKRMANESGFTRVEFFFPPIGFIPKTQTRWQSLMPWLTGKNWCDCLIAVLVK
jgi:SAM-dependent methyltransferase